jgi:hypothetical protein
MFNRNDSYSQTELTKVLKAMYSPMTDDDILTEPVALHPILREYAALAKSVEYS